MLPLGFYNASLGTNTSRICNYLKHTLYYLTHSLIVSCRFEALVEREWLQAGHPFSDRCAKSAHAITKGRQESPVFLMFLDCVWQVRLYGTVLDVYMIYGRYVYT